MRERKRQRERGGESEVRDGGKGREENDHRSESGMYDPSQERVLRVEG